MGMLNKKSMVNLVIGAVMLISGCSLTQEEKAGGELIKAAREEYVSLDSAKVIITNDDTGRQEQVFTFKYDEKDILIYSYYGESENSVIAQYNNGAESFTYENGEYSHAVKGESDYVQYNRASTYPQADEALLIYQPECIISDEEKIFEDQTREYTHKYDPEKIGADTEEGEVEDFTVKYYFDKDGNLSYFMEITQVKTTDENGNEVVKTYPYKIEITQKNSVQKVENTTDRFRNDALEG